tara:strand:+ start:129 stop:329 length:201 start_codon:yes stop_codon:yes gene_type:complete
MSASIFKFIEKVNEAERSGQREIVFKLQEAQGLHVELTRLLTNLEILHSASASGSSSDLEVNGGTF